MSNHIAVRQSGLLIVTAFMAILAGPQTSADVPPLLNYQGRLTAVGTAVDTVVPITFTIYVNSDGIGPLWIETHPAVSVENGLFAVLLGSVVALPSAVFDDDDRYLGIQIGAEPQATPLTRIVSVAYAIQAARADTASYAHTSPGGNGWTDDGTVVRLTNSGDKIGIGTSTPTNMVHIVGSDSQPLLNIEKTGSGRGLRISTVSACALWVAASGNHGLRVTSANGDGVHVTSAGGYAGYFNGKGYFGGNLGVGTLTAGERLDVVGGSIRTDGQLKSTVADGTPPLEVQSETMVSNLNADQLDGKHAEDFAVACAGTESAIVDAAGSVSFSFTGADFSAIPMLSASILVETGTGAGSPARITGQSVTTTGAELALQVWSDSAFTSLDEGASVQVSWVAAQ